jgi:hypothetical protein
MTWCVVAQFQAHPLLCLPGVVRIQCVHPTSHCCSADLTSLQAQAQALARDTHASQERTVIISVTDQVPALTDRDTASPPPCPHIDVGGPPQILLAEFDEVTGPRPLSWIPQGANSWLVSDDFSGAALHWLCNPQISMPAIQSLAVQSHSDLDLRPACRLLCLEPAPPFGVAQCDHMCGMAGSWGAWAGKAVLCSCVVCGVVVCGVGVVWLCVVCSSVVWWCGVVWCGVVWWSPTP